MEKVFRYYQQECDDGIYEELHNNNKCLVKMFCGTGKSLLMRKCKIIDGKNLVVFVFPTLSLIDQFYNDYFDGDKDNILRISSENESTTDPLVIKSFLFLDINKIICVTYQSFNTLLVNLGEMKINVCIFDEAHHAVGETYQKLIFDNDVCEKQIFFTATPKNANGIIMYERGLENDGMCGKMVYDYPYLKGVKEGYLNPFEIRIDMYTENNNKSIYECIARAVLESKNNRVLTFHADVNTDRDKSVHNFVNEIKFREVFLELKEREYPTQKYKKITMIGLVADMNIEKRRKLLNKFDKAKSNEVVIISSCETIGEGIDTKNANMCVFVDSKSSYVKIIQNIGRIVRKTFEKNKPNSTILIPCWVDRTKYLECNGDKEKCDEVIRSSMNESGDFNSILNVCSALKQEDEDLYDICLHYPDTYSPQEIIGNLEKQGYVIDDSGEGYLSDTLEYLLETEIEYDDFDTNEELIMNIAEDNDICIEVHTNSLENPIEKYNTECKSKETIRMYKSEDEEDTKYHPIIHKVKNTRRNNDVVRSPNKDRRLNIKVHTNADTKVLWNITSDIDFTKDVCSCVIDCEVVDKWEENFQKLKDYINENKKRPPQGSKDNVGKFLGNWLANQQQCYKNKRGGMKSEERYDTWTKFLEDYKEYLLNFEELWNDNFQKLKNYIDENKRRPTHDSKDKYEKLLSSWVSNQKNNYKIKKDGMKIQARCHRWKQFLEEYMEYFIYHEENWYINFQKLKDYINENKKRPKNKSRDKDEKILGIWFISQNRNYKNKQNGMKIQERRDVWKQFLEEYNEYFISDEENWYINFQKLKDYINEHKKLPPHGSNDDVEKKIASWLSNQQHKYKHKIKGMKSHERYDLWRQFLEEYMEYFINDEENWYINFQKLKDFINENKRRPTKESKDNVEKKIGNWISIQNTNYKIKKDGMKSQERCDVWKQFLEEYNEYVISDEEKWDDYFQKLKDYINENKRRPSGRSNDTVEKILGNWLNNQNQNYKNKGRCMKSQDRYDVWRHFLEEYNEYFISDEEKWDDYFQKLKFYIDENKKRPSSKSKNDDEKFLGNWLTHQNRIYKNKEFCIKSHEMYDLWTQFIEDYKKYLLNDKEKWEFNFQKLKDYIDKNKKRPSQHSKDNDEKFLGRWLSGQLQNYKNKKDGMKSQDRYVIWTQFLEEYKEYFNKSDDKSECSDIKNSKKSMKLQQNTKQSMEPTETNKQKRNRIHSAMSILHQRYKTLNSSNLSKEFNENPDLWHTYHNISEENEKSFPEEEIPRNRIISELNKIKTKRRKIVVDMGCGKGHISKHYSNDSRFQFHNYDHISSNETIIPCDISTLPLEDDSVEICILSLVMWGSNCKDYIGEARRVLESGGKMYIIEPTKRWTEKDDSENLVVGKEGGKLKQLLCEYGFHILEEYIEKFCLIVCVKN